MKKIVTITWVFFVIFNPVYIFANQNITPIISYLLADNKSSSTSISPIVSYLLSDNKNLGKIMPLGDSITFDWYYGDSRPESLRTGYRSHLWWKLKERGYIMDFVGSRNTGGAVSPSFDGNNEGYTGWTVYYIAKNISTFLKNNPPDTILLHIGTNNPINGYTYDQSVNDVSYILDRVDEFERSRGIKIKVILARVLKCKKHPGWMEEFNRRLGAMAQRRIDAGDDLVVVDMENGAGIDYNKDLRDGIHPTNCGYEKMANVWFRALTGKNPPPLQFCH